MLIELLVSTVLVCVTVLIHGWGLWLIGWVVAAEAEDKAHHPTRTQVEAAWLIAAMALGLFVLHGLEIWFYALVFYGLGAIQNLRDAVYVSTANYASIGAEHPPIAVAWRLVGAIEGINGVILIGWTTAFFVTVLGRLKVKRPKAKPPA